jgi:hypothetical protein
MNKQSGEKVFFPANFKHVYVHFLIKNTSFIPANLLSRKNLIFNGLQIVAESFILYLKTIKDYKTDN